MLAWLLPNRVILAGTAVYADSIHFEKEGTRSELLQRNAGVSRASRKMSPFEARVPYRAIHEEFPQIVQVT